MRASRQKSTIRVWVYYLAGRIPDWILRAINKLISLTVDDRAFQKTEKFPWIPEVEALHGGIRADVEKLLKHIDELPTIHEIIPANDYYFSEADWRQCAFYTYGNQIEDHCALFPNTWRAMQLIPGLATASISVLGPGEVIPKHNHAYKGLLIYHVAVIIPRDGDGCGIKMGGETRTWEEGKVLIIDPTFDHEVWNKTAHHRVILLGEFRRPDLPGYLRVFDFLYLQFYKLTVGKFLTAQARLLAAQLRKHFQEAGVAGTTDAHAASINP